MVIWGLIFLETVIFPIFCLLNFSRSEFYSSFNKEEHVGYRMYIGAAIFGKRNLPQDLTVVKLGGGQKTIPRGDGVPAEF